MEAKTLWGKKMTEGIKYREWINSEVQVQSTVLLYSSDLKSQILLGVPVLLVTIESLGSQDRVLVSFPNHTNKQMKSFSCMSSIGPSISRGGQLLMVWKVKEKTFINRHIINTSSTKDLSVTVLSHFTSVVPFNLHNAGSFYPHFTDVNWDSKVKEIVLGYIASKLIELILNSDLPASKAF